LTRRDPQQYGFAAKPDNNQLLIEAGQMKPRTLTPNILAILIILISLLPSAATDWNAEGKRWWSHIEYLASNELEGRNTGSEGHRKAADPPRERRQALHKEVANTHYKRAPLLR